VKLYSRPWEKRLRRRIRAAVRPVPSLWQEYRRRRHRWYRRNIASPVLLLFFWGLLVLFPLSLLNENRPIELPLILGATGFALWRSNGLFHPLRSEFLNNLLAHYPIARATAFRQVSRAWLWRGVWIFVLVLAPVGGALLEQHRWAVALQLIVAQWVVMHITAVCLTAVKHRRTIRWLGLLFFGLAVAAWWQPAPLAGLEPGARWLLPAGWAFAVAHGQWIRLIPVAVLMAGSVMSWQRLRTAYLTQPDAETFPPAVTDEDEEAALPPAEPKVTPQELRETEDRIRTGAALRPVVDTPADTLGRWLWRWLSPVERDIFRFVTNDFASSLTQQWRFGILFATGAVVLGGCLSATLALWIVGIGVWISLVCLGAEPSGGDGSRLRVWGLYPLRFWDVARTGLKTMFLLLVCWLPVPVVSGATLALKWGAPATVGLVIGGKVAVLLFVLLPIGIASHVSSITNDSRSPHCSTRLALLATLTAVLIIGGGLAFLLAPMIPAMAGVLVALLASGWFLRCYGRWFNQMRFDLMPFVAPAR